MIKNYTYSKQKLTTTELCGSFLMEKVLRELYYFQRYEFCLVILIMIYFCLKKVK